MTGILNEFRILPATLLISMALWLCGAPAIAKPAPGSTLIVVITTSKSSKLPAEPKLLFVAPTGQKIAKILARQTPSEISQLIEVNDASTDEITKVFQNLSASSNNQFRRFIVAFIGYADTHGLYSADGHIENDEFYAAINAVQIPEKVVLVDACFTGSAPRSGVSTLTSTTLPRLVYDPTTSTAFLIASSTRSAPFESARFQETTFGHFMIAGMSSKADRNSDNVVSLGELQTYVATAASFQMTSLLMSRNPVQLKKIKMTETRKAGKIPMVLTRDEVPVHEVSDARLVAKPQTLDAAPVVERAGPKRPMYLRVEATYGQQSGLLMESPKSNQYGINLYALQFPMADFVVRPVIGIRTSKHKLETDTSSQTASHTILDVGARGEYSLAKWPLNLGLALCAGQMRSSQIVESELVAETNTAMSPTIATKGFMGYRVSDQMTINGILQIIGSRISDENGTPKNINGRMIGLGVEYAL